MARKPAQKKSTTPLMDWTVSAAPEPGEEPPPEAGAGPIAQAPGAGRRPAASGSQRVTLMLAGLIAASLLAVGLSAAWNSFRLRQTLSRAVSLEEQSIRSGDRDQLDQLYPAQGDNWAALQRRRAEDGQVAPLPLQSLWPAFEAGSIQSIKTLASDTALVNVTRRFYAPDGSRVDFVLPQYYRFVGGQWRRQAPPPELRSEIRQRLSTYLEISYYAVDEAYAAALGTYLDQVLTGACSAWDCPPTLTFHLRLLLDDTAVMRSFDYFPASPGAPLLFSLMLAQRDSFWATTTLPLGAPHLAGYPADPESQAVFQRLIAVELISRLTGLLVPDSLRFNTLLYALAARLTASLQLDAPEITRLQLARPAFTAEELWDLNYVSTVRPLGPFYTQSAQNEALAALNLLLEAQSPRAEQRLFNGLSQAEQPDDWLARGLRLSPQAARAALDDALADMARVPAATSIATAQAFTLGCRNGLATFSPGDERPDYFLSGRFFDARPLAWSPEGARLLIELSGQPAVIEAATGQVTWLPDTLDYYDQLQWIDNQRLAYVQWPRDLFRSPYRAAQFSLRFLDVTAPAETLPAVAGLQDFALSPDRSMLAVVEAQTAPVFSGEGTIAVIPVAGGPPRSVARGFAPAWAPDGRRLVFAQTVDEHVVLQVLDVASGATRQIFDSAEWGVLGQQLDVWATWAASGERLAVVIQGRYGDDHAVWTLHPDGSGTRLIHEQDSPAYAAPASFSADGRYVAVTAWSPYWSRQTVIYDAATGERGVRLPNVGGWSAWAPSGHTLALSSADGLYAVEEPGSPRAIPRRLSEEGCYQALWNAAP
jgi:hypothetical protein